jgi:large conductance mechanosensitive channel
VLFFRRLETATTFANSVTMRYFAFFRNIQAIIIIRHIKKRREISLKDFKAWIMRGNVVDIAIGIIIGAAFGVIISSLVKDIIMPPVGLALGNVDFSNLFVVIKQGVPVGPYDTLAAAQSAGAVTINYGNFVNTIIIFLIIALILFFGIVRPIARAHAKQAAAVPPAAPNTKECPFCASNIPIKATKCPNCTSDLKK